jgi:hypothetical protein
MSAQSFPGMPGMQGMAGFPGMPGMIAGLPPGMSLGSGMMFPGGMQSMGSQGNIGQGGNGVIPYLIMPNASMVQPGNALNQTSRGNDSNKKDSGKDKD